MSILVDQFMRHSGFMPHNGHGYIRTAPRNDIVTDTYSFVYHEAVYGDHTHDLMGFGVNAISSTVEHVLTNEQNRRGYIDAINAGTLPMHCSQHDRSLDYSRPIILRLPYHGVTEKALLHRDRMPADCLERLRKRVSEGLVEAARARPLIQSRRGLGPLSML